jgi:fumarylpyruvate hydrolase
VTCRPWDLAKGFDASAPIGVVVPAAGIDPTSGSVTLHVDGELRQSGDLSDQIWSVAETIAALSRAVRLEPGDLLFTGTPDGVGPVTRGSVLRGAIDGVGTVETRIV